MAPPLPPLLLLPLLQPWVTGVGDELGARDAHGARGACSSRLLAEPPRSSAGGSGSRALSSSPFVAPWIWRWLEGRSSSRDASSSSSTRGGYGGGSSFSSSRGGCGGGNSVSSSSRGGCVSTPSLCRGMRDVRYRERTAAADGIGIVATVTRASPSHC